MKKKVKKIPKFEEGKPGFFQRIGSGFKKFGNNIVDNFKNMETDDLLAGISGAGSALAGGLGIEQTGFSQTAEGLAPLLDMALPGLGTGFKTFALFTGGGGGTDGFGNAQKATGLTRWFGLGRSDDSVMRQANREKGSILAKLFTEDLQANWMNQGINPAPNVLAAEGGIMRQSVDALVSKGELIYNPVTKKLSQVPGSKGKPNKADDVYAKLYEGDVVISNSPTMIMANGKTPALNLMGMVNKYSTGGTVKAREAIIKKVVNWQEANKTHPLKYAKFDEGIKGVNKYGYNINLSDFAYWDKDKNEYKKEYLDWVNNLTEQDVRDIEAGKYGDMSEYFSKNKGKKLDVATAQKLMTDKKYGNWHKIGQAVVDKKIKSAKETPLVATPIKMDIVGVDSAMWQNKYAGKYPIDYTVTSPDMNLKRLPNPSEADGIIAANRTLRKAARNAKLNNIGEAISDLAPFAAALFGDYDYHTEQPYISPAKYIPTGVSIEPIRRAANDSYAMARYNQENISPNTGAGMAYGLLAASNRAKALADAYTWQQDAQNKLIAQNMGIYNDWAKRYDTSRYQAVADTRANEGAAQQMRDSAIRDALEFTQGRKNDRMRLAMMEPLAKYAFDDDTYRKIYSRVIV